MYYINEEMGSKRKRRVELRKIRREKDKEFAAIQVIYSGGIRLVICQDDTNLHGSHGIPCENFARARVHARTGGNAHNRIRYTNITESFPYIFSVSFLFNIRLRTF